MVSVLQNALKYVLQVASGNGSRSTRRFGCYSATNLSTQSISANSLLAAAPQTAMLRSWQTRMTTPPSARQPHRTVDWPICTDRTATKRALMQGKLSLDWKRQFCMYNFNVYYLKLFFKCRNQRLVVKCLQVSGSIRTRRAIFIIFHL